MAVIIVEEQFSGDPTFEKLQLWVIPVAIEGTQRKLTYNLLLDTGAQRTVLVPNVQKEVGIEKISSGSVPTTLGHCTVGKANNMEIGSIALGSLDVLVGTLPGLSGKYQINGLLGADILQKFCLTIDYPKKLLRIEKTIFCP